MWEDPIVAEIQQIREKLLEEAGGDMHELIKRMNERAAAWPGPKVTVEELRASRAAREKSAAVTDAKYRGFIG